MARKLVVTHAFADYAVADEITDPAKVAELLETHRHAVVPVEFEEKAAEPAPAPVPAKAAGNA